MGSITDKINTVWRDYVTAGVASSGAQEPVKSEIREIGPIIEAAISNAGLGALVSVVYATKAELDADLAHDADSVGLVYGDATDANNDLYIKTGASGAGSWTLTTALHDIIEGLAQPFVDAAELAQTGSEAALAGTTTVARTISTALADQDFSLGYNSTAYTILASFATAKGAMQVFVDWDDIAGDFVDAWADKIGINTGGTKIKLTLIDRDLAGSGINSAYPQSCDTLIGEYEFTLEELGLTAGAAPTGICLPATFARQYRQANHAVGVMIEGLNDADAAINLYLYYNNWGDGTQPQRRAGFVAATATPSTFTNNNTAFRKSVSLYAKATRGDLVAAIDDADAAHWNEAQVNLTRMNALNVASMNAMAGAYALDAGIVTFNGDSLTADTAGGKSATETRVGIVDGLMAGTILNLGVGGQTSTQITDRTVNSSGATPGTYLNDTQRGGIVPLQMGTNNLTTSTAADILAQYASCFTAIDGLGGTLLAYSPTASGGIVASQNGVKRREIADGLIAAYGANAVDMHMQFSRYAADVDNDAGARRGGVPDYLLFDSTHTNKGGSFVRGMEDAALVAATAGFGVYVHDDIMRFDPDAAAGSSIGQVRYAGTALGFLILSGNDDGAFRVNPETGAITRGAGSATKPYYELFVQAISRYGHGRNGRIVLAASQADGVPSHAVSIVGNGQSVLTLPGSATLPTGGEMTIVITARMKRGVAGNIFGGGNGFASMSVERVRFLPYTVAGGVTSLTVSVENPYEWNTYFLSVNTATPTAVAQASEGASVSTVPNASDIKWADLYAMFTNNGGDSAPLKNFEILMLGIWPDFIDITNSANRDLFYDSATRLPNDMSDPTFGGAISDPWVLMYGREGDWLTGRNRGTGGDWYAPHPTGPANRGFPQVDI